MFGCRCAICATDWRAVILPIASPPFVQRPDIVLVRFLLQLIVIALFSFLVNPSPFIKCVLCSSFCFLIGGAHMPPPRLKGFALCPSHLREGLSTFPVPPWVGVFRRFPDFDCSICCGDQQISQEFSRSLLLGTVRLGNGTEELGESRRDPPSPPPWSVGTLPFPPPSSSGHSRSHSVSPRLVSRSRRLSAKI